MPAKANRAHRRRLTITADKNALLIWPKWCNALGKLKLSPERRKRPRDAGFFFF
jgi:hypothetical protein